MSLIPATGWCILFYVIVCCCVLILSIFRDAIYMDDFKTLRPSATQLKNTKHKDKMRVLNFKMEQREKVLTRTLAWLLEGVTISQTWIEFVVDDRVKAYMNFSEGWSATSNTRSNVPANNHPQISTSNNDAIVVEGFHRMRITEIEDM